MDIIFLIPLIIIVLGSFVYTAACKLRLKKSMELMDEMIDKAINGTLTETTYDETMITKLEARLNRFLVSGALSKNALQNDKDNINSLVSDISHQTKTIVSNILLYTGLLKEKNLAADEKSYTDKIESQTEKLSFLLDSLLKASRLETGIININENEVSINLLVENVINMCNEKTLSKDMKIVFEKGDEIFTKLDIKWTQEAIFNILDNAIKYSKKNGEILINVNKYEMFVRIDIRDFGIGISEEDMSKIFTRFYRSQNVSNYEGVGLGLYLAREIISKEGGYILASSKEGEGSTFSVSLPLR